MFSEGESIKRKLRKAKAGFTASKVHRRVTHNGKSRARAVQRPDAGTAQEWCRQSARLWVEAEVGVESKDE